MVKDDAFELYVIFDEKLRILHQYTSYLNITSLAKLKKKKKNQVLKKWQQTQTQNNLINEANIVWWKNV